MKNYIVYNLDCEGRSIRGIAGYISTDSDKVTEEFEEKNTGCLPSMLLKAVEISNEILLAEHEKLTKHLLSITKCLNA